MTRTVIGSRIERAMAVPLRTLHPPHCVCIGGCAQFSARHAAQIIGDHVVVADALALAMNPVENLNQFNRLHLQPGFFPHFARNPGGQRLAHFEHAARQRPMALERLAPAPHQQHPALLDDHRAHAHERRLRKLALQLSFHSANLSRNLCGSLSQRAKPSLHRTSPAIIK